jgi:hypothetical protein
MATPLPPWQRRATALVAVLATTSSLLGLFRPGHYPPTLRPAFYVQDLVILLVGVPALVLGLRAAVAGSPRGRTVWLGALAFMTYMWASVGLSVPFNRFFLGYVALFGLSLFTFVGGVVDTEPAAVAATLGDGISERRYGAVLGFIAAGLAALWLSELVPATLTGTPPLLVTEQGPQALVSHFLDLAVVVPALAVVARWLWQRRAWGYVLAGVALVFGALLAPAITGMTLALFLTGAVTLPPVAVVFTALPALVAVTFAVGYLRRVPGADRDGRPDAAPSA